MAARLAIADDEPCLLKSLKRILEMRGFEVVVAANDGAGLLEGVARHLVDGIITDFHMEHGGSAMLQLLRQQYPKIPVYVLSGGMRNAEEVLAAGARRLYLKGTDIASMLREIQDELAATCEGPSGSSD